MRRPARAGPKRRAVRALARAKLNLGLAVGPRRADGYHEIATIFQTISLADDLTFRPRRAGFALEVAFDRGASRGEVGGVPRGAGNLVVAAAELMRAEHGIAGAHIRLRKRIPVASGMGGASADAAATIAGLARLFGLRLSRRRRMELGLRLGSDVPFAVMGGTALGLGRGERLWPLRLKRPFRAVIAVPRWRVSTALAFRRIDAGKYGLTAWGAKLRFAQALGRDGVTALAAQRLGNTFELALGNRNRHLDSLRERLSAAGLQAPRMTGSGSAVFGILPARKSAKIVLSRFVGDERLYIVRSASQGTRIAET
jgi:4-diphosphocytidyl-2-C-methyl-D-erythritol kinase